MKKNINRTKTSKKQVKSPAHKHTASAGIRKTIPRKPQNPLRQWFWHAFGFKSIGLALLSGLLVYAAMRKNSGYTWVWTNYLKGNWEFIKAHDTATIEQINEMKIGFNYVFLNYVKKHTPDTAVILFPLRSQITEKGGNMQLGIDVSVKMWATHFVYPRRILYKDEYGENPLYDSVTHVAIAAAHGYDDLDYFVQKRAYFDVLPKKINNN
jgi:hypothetical protein